MLLENYYIVKSCTTESDSAVFHVHLCPDCKVYEGHFPGEPVSPGVCNIQMMLECAAQVAGHRLRTTVIKRCRLTALITPLTHPELDVHIQLTEKEGGAYDLNASIGMGENTYLSLKAEVVNDAE